MYDLPLIHQGDGATIKTHDIKTIAMVKRLPNKNIAVHLTLKHNMKLWNPHSNITKPGHIPGFHDLLFNYYTQ